jgi:chromosome segregation ATPase
MSITNQNDELQASLAILRDQACGKVISPDQSGPQAAQIDDMKVHFTTEIHSKRKEIHKLNSELEKSRRELLDCMRNFRHSEEERDRCQARITELSAEVRTLQNQVHYFTEFQSIRIF